MSRYAELPVRWNASSGEGILWKVETPLPGANSPIVWQGRVFLCGATEQRREVWCVDADKGDFLWRRVVSPPSEGAGTVPKVGRDTSFAAPTMATDGRLAYAIFATGVLSALDFEGNEVWSRSLGLPHNNYGHASSLVTYKGSLIVQFDQGTRDEGRSQLLALDGATGQVKWHIRRPVPASWSSPIVVNQGARPIVITCSDPWVTANAADNGEELWRANCLAPAEVAPSPIFSDGLVFVANEYAALTAIRTGGRGDVTSTHVAWSADQGLPDICSPLATDRFILLLTSSGTLTCYDKHRGGPPLWSEDFELEFASSPSRAGNLVYLISRQGKVLIVEPTPSGCRRIATAELGESCLTTPAFQEGRIYIRGDRHLFAIGAK